MVTPSGGGDHPMGMPALRSRRGVTLPLQLPRRTQFEFAIKAGVGASLSLWIATAVGLEDPYWSAVSAVVATAGTLGASVGAAVTRVLATVVALLLAVAFVAVVPFSGEVVAGLLVALALLVMFALSLEAGARLAAASTLIVTAASGGDPVGIAVSRGLNVPLGCAVAVILGLVLLPRRAARQLAGALRDDEVAALGVAGELVAAYVAGAGPDAGCVDALSSLGQRVGGHRATLADAAREPGSGRRVVDQLADQLAVVETLLGIDDALSRIAVAARGDVAMVLVGSELSDVAAVLGRAESLGPALQRLDASFAAVRQRRGTVDYRTEELARLLAVMRQVHNLDAVVHRRPQS